ncbi:transposase [Micromonospora sp. MW-13]|uniref:transposase n=1 Tax=Micromonospora sp. MW-13 TaxID=2094022 RepID=UPI00352C050C
MTPTPSPAAARSASPSVSTSDGAKRIKGRNRHIATDTLGLLLAVVVTAASVPDSTAGRHLLDTHVRGPSDRGQGMGRRRSQHGRTVRTAPGSASTSNAYPATPGRAPGPTPVSAAAPPPTTCKKSSVRPSTSTATASPGATVATRGARQRTPMMGGWRGHRAPRSRRW